MKAFFKIISFIGLVLTSVIFGFVFYGEKTIPNDIHLIENEEFNVGGIYSLDVLQSKEVLSANTQTRTASNDSNEYSVNISVLNTIPVKSSKVTVSKRKYVVPGGDVFGIRLFTKGVLVVGTDDVYTVDGTVNPAKKAGIEIGDLIISLNGAEVNSVADVSKILKSAGADTIQVQVTRNAKSFETELTPAQSRNDGLFKAGLWVRDSTAGVGTITYFDYETGAFGSLGHAVCDVDTGEIMPLGNGDAVETVISGCYRGSNGITGELCGVFQEKTIGRLVLNCANGIYGYLDRYESSEGQLPVATRQEVKLGSAQIISTVDDTGPHYYDVRIVKLFSSNSETSKNMIVEITDPQLIAKTGGIVQGMSGSPIIQNGMLVGAVTHVFVNNPLQGYGIFADNMIGISNSLTETEIDKAS